VKSSPIRQAIPKTATKAVFVHMVRALDRIGKGDALKQAAGVRVAQSWSYEVVVQQYLSVYQSMIGQG